MVMLVFHNLLLWCIINKFITFVSGKPWKTCVDSSDKPVDIPYPISGYPYTVDNIFVFHAFSTRCPQFLWITVNNVFQYVDFEVIIKMKCNITLKKKNAKSYISIHKRQLLFDLALIL